MKSTKFVSPEKFLNVRMPRSNVRMPRSGSLASMKWKCRRCGFVASNGSEVFAHDDEHDLPGDWEVIEL